MKKIIAKILIILSIISIFWFTQNSYAEKETDPVIAWYESPDEKSSDWKNSIYVTAEVPWANCVVATKEWKEWLYKCDVERGFWAIMNIMWNMIKYFTFISWLLAVLTIVVGWIAYSMWWADDSLKTKSKEFIQKSLMWLIILLLSWTILYAVAPWVYN